MFNRLFFGSHPLRVLMMAEDGAGGAAGGGASGGGAGAGAGAGDGKGGAAAGGDGGGAAIFTPEQQRALNAAISAHVSRLEKKIPTADSFKDAFAGLLDEKFKALQPQPGAGGAKPGGDGGDGVPEPVKQELARLKSELDKTTQRANEERKQREEQEAKAKRTEERNAITAVLRDVQIPEHQIAPLAAWLHAESGKVKRDETGQIVFGVPRPEWGRDQVEWLPVSEGMAAWLTGTDEGKRFLPPKDTRGSGARGGNAPGLRPKKPEEFSMADLGEAIMASRG